MKKFKDLVKKGAKAVMNNKTTVAALALVVTATTYGCAIWILGAEDAPECMIEE